MCYRPDSNSQPIDLKASAGDRYAALGRLRNKDCRSNPLHHPIRKYPHASYCADRADPRSGLACYIIKCMSVELSVHNVWHLCFLQMCIWGILTHAPFMSKRCSLTEKRIVRVENKSLRQRGSWWRWLFWLCVYVQVEWGTNQKQYLCT